MNTALFVDFDNVYLGLRDIDVRAAERFATDPLRWIRWLSDTLAVNPESELGSASSKPADSGHRMLIQKCYMNPGSFGRYRPYFTRAAVQVVDCPPLTSQGKTSADIYMAIDILDTFQTRPHIDQFAILSADADFTPVLLRLREFGRRTVGLAAGPSSAAYRNVFDVMVEIEDFLEGALGIPAGDESPVPAEGPGSSERLREMGAALVAEAASREGRALAAHELPSVYTRFEEFRESNWLGYGTLQSLTSAILRVTPELRFVDGDPWRVFAREPELRTADEVNRQSGERASPDVGATEIVSIVAQVVAESEVAVPLATAAGAVIDKLGTGSLSWASYGSFGRLLEMNDLGELLVQAAPPPGYVYDPARHELPTARTGVDRFEGCPDELVELAQRVHNITDAPLLSPVEYATMFRFIAQAITEEPFHLTQTSRRVRDWCLEDGRAVPRQAVNFLLKGLTYAGALSSSSDHSPQSLAGAFQQNVEKLLAISQVELTVDEQGLLHDWLAGEVSAE